VPDFLIQKGPYQVAVEAVTVNSTVGVVPPRPNGPEEERELCENYMPIKWGSPLISKLRKCYWKKDHVRERPLVFAIHDFHDLGSMIWSLPALSDYLYGVRGGDNGDDSPIESHSYGGKTIPSGFFSLPDAEYVSAVIASNEATLTKFNRMGKIAGFGDISIEIRRFGVVLDLETFTDTPFESVTEIGVESENWSSGLWVFHNPKAKFPLHEDLFPTALQVILQDGQRYFFSSRQMHVMRSFTTITEPSK
jgi:hypothetical protein